VTADEAVRFAARLDALRGEIESTAPLRARSWALSHVAAATRHLEDASSAMRNAAGHLLPDPDG
jgi:hypothetical protein